ncbi:ArsR/SmtB family transcription factor, partial [Streptomyces violascens]|uniref:ArsR/SmtB family transcription factor n=1 Tax=Streptomyces violascens TaxID=67381 RepID=UPI00379E266A
GPDTPTPPPAPAGQCAYSGAGPPPRPPPRRAPPPPAALLNIGAGCGTTELADRLGVSAGTASVHVTALRNGGLVATHRVGKAVNHVLTPVGSALITAQLTMEPVMLPPMP